MPAIVWKGYVSFGLVSFPVKLFAAARAEAIHFHMLHQKDLSRVKEVWYCAEEDKAIKRSDMVKGYEVSKGKYVVVEEEELKKIAPPTATMMEVTQFVATDEVDPILFERSYYVGPDEKVSKPYALFVQAMKETERCAVAKLTMHGREHVVLMRVSEGGLVLHTLFYGNELHKANKQAKPEKAGLNRKELDLAKTLVEQFSGPFKPDEFHDVYRENVEKLIAQKRKGQKVTVIAQPKPEKVTDLMEALQQSINKGAKPGAKKHTRKVA